MPTEPPLQLQPIGYVASLLGVTEKRAYDLHQRGILPGGIKIGRQLRFNPQVVEAWIAAGGSKASA